MRRGGGRRGKLREVDEAVMRAAIAANANTFITSMPDGYHTVGSGNQVWIKSSIDKD